MQGRRKTARAKTSVTSVAADDGCLQWWIAKQEDSRRVTGKFSGEAGSCDAMATVWRLLEVMAERWGVRQRPILKFVDRTLWLIIGYCRPRSLTDCWLLEAWSRCRLLERCGSDWWLRMVEDGRGYSRHGEGQRLWAKRPGG
ncbi:histidine kinase [Sesbania bispinosa]|nr:histidine kinase [Sesbania bispinosa]